jgi:hypothetical protein
MIQNVQTPEMLKLLMDDNAKVPAKICCLEGAFNYDYWDFFKSNCCTIGNEATECASLVAALEYFACCPLATVANSEMCLASIMDAAFYIFVMYCGRDRERNVTTHTSASKKPDYSLSKGRSPLVHGEEKLKSNYVVGRYGQDPIHECEAKTPWARWTDFYGDTPYILAYACVGDAIDVIVIVGLLVKETQCFFELFRIDLGAPANRPIFAMKLLKLLPTLAYIDKQSESAVMMMGPLSLKNNLLFCVRCSVEIVVHDGEPMVEKQWTFPTAADCDKFHTRMTSISTKLGDNSLLQFQQISKYDDNALKVRAYFKPVGAPCYFTTVREVVFCVKAIAEQVEKLIAEHVVHNDIRWANIVAFGGSFLLIDYDDAEVLSPDGTCPGLSHLSEVEHCPAIKQPHAHEVDVWALGKLLAIQPSSQSSIRLSNDVMTNSNTWGIVEVKNKLQQYLDENGL